MGDVWSLGNSFWRDLGGAGVVRATLSYDITLRGSGPLSMTRSQAWVWQSCTLQLVVLDLNYRALPNPD